MYIPIVPKNVYGELGILIVEEGVRKATKYLTGKEVVKATRRLHNKKIDKRDKRIEIIFTIGVPNHEEREFIKKAKKAGEPFPIKKIQIKWPKK